MVSFALSNKLCVYCLYQSTMLHKYYYNVLSAVSIIIITLCVILCTCFLSLHALGPDSPNIISYDIVCSLLAQFAHECMHLCILNVHIVEKSNLKQISDVVPDK